MDYDFSKLTPSQEWLICYQGWRVGQTYPNGSLWPQPSQRTVKKLIERGLMQEVVRTIQSSKDLSLRITEYHVPLDVHAAWCFSCASGTDLE